MQKLTNHIDAKPFNLKIDLKKEDIITFYLGEFFPGSSFIGQKDLIIGFLDLPSIYTFP